MKTFPISLIVLFLFPISSYATIQPDSLRRTKTLFETITSISKKHDLLNVKLNTRIAFHSILHETTAEQSAFRLDYLRLEVTGNITDRIYYKWMQHLNRSNKPHSFDNTPSSIDCLGIGFHLTPTLSAFAGKQYADFGGFEYDANPAEVYEFSDMGDRISCFLVGVNVSWWFKPTQELRFQVTNARADKAEEHYGLTPDNYKTAKTPLGYIVNWNGKFLNQRLLTRCSFSLFHEGKQQNVYFMALAAAWVQEKFNIYIDGMYSVEEIDKLGILSELFTKQVEKSPRVLNSNYLSLVSRVNYRIFPKFNLFAKGMYETASIYKTTASREKGKYRTSFGYQGGVEYFPWQDNFRFYILCHGRKINFTDRAKATGIANEHPQYLSLGLTYKIPIY